MIMPSGPRRRASRAGLWAFLLALPLGPGCYGAGTQMSVEARELYRFGAFELERLERGRVTVLAARMSFGQEGYAGVLVQGLTEVLEARLGDSVVHPNRVGSQLNEALLAPDYGTMMEAYDRTGILDRDVLQRFSQVTRVRYFALPIQVAFREEISSRLSVFGLRLFKTSSANARFQLQIWDGRSGRIVWEGISDLTLAREVIRESPVRFEEIAEATWESLISEIPSAAAVAAPPP